jgi:hypothetical protein
MISHMGRGRFEAYLAIMLPGSATLRVYFRGPVGANVADGFDVSLSPNKVSTLRFLFCHQSARSTGFDHFTEYSWIV